jgi:hypothetical protein
MRQAGRSQPEYRKLKEKYSLFDITHQPELCAYVTHERPACRINQTGVCVVSSPLIIFKIVLFLLCTIKAVRNQNIEN